MSQIAQYGAVMLLRSKCSKCGEMGFIIEGKTVCCDAPYSGEPTTSKMMSEGPGKRKAPAIAEKKRIIQEQEAKCLYCGFPFGTFYSRGGKVYESAVVFDHAVPFSYLQDNPKSNWVASCNVCNSIKSNKMFNDLEGARQYITDVRHRKKILFAHEQIQKPVKDESKRPREPKKNIPNRTRSEISGAEYNRVRKKLATVITQGKMSLRGAGRKTMVSYSYLSMFLNGLEVSPKIIYKIKKGLGMNRKPRNRKDKRIFPGPGYWVKDAI